MAGALFGEVQLSVFVAGAVFGEVWNGARNVIFSMENARGAKSNLGCAAGCGLTGSC